MRERLKKALVLFCGFALSWLFLPRIWFALPMSFVAERHWRLIQRQRRQETEKRKIRIQFRLFLDLFSTGLRVGANPYHALESSYPELCEVYGAEASVPRALLKARNAISFGASFRRALDIFSLSLSEPAVTQFCAGMKLGIVRGTDLRKLALSYHRLLSEKMELEEERDAGLAGTKREQRLLFAMPPILLLAMRGMGIDAGTPGPFDVISRIVSGILFFIAYRWSKSIVDDADPDVMAEKGISG